MLLRITTYLFFSLITCQAFALTNNQCGLLLSTEKTVDMHFSETDAVLMSDFKKAKDFYTDKVLSTYKGNISIDAWEAPENEVERLAFFEVLSNFYFFQLGFKNSKHSLSLTPQNWPRVSSLIRSWGHDNQITSGDLFQLMDSYSSDIALSPWRLSNWKTWLFGRDSRAQIKVEEQIQKFLVSEEFLNAKFTNLDVIPGKPKKRIKIRKVLTSTLLWFLIQQMPNFTSEKIPYSKIKKRYNEIAETQQQEGSLSAYQKLRKILLPKQARRINFSWYAKILNSAIALSIAGTLVYEIESEFPVQMLWTSHEEAVEHIIAHVEEEYMQEHEKEMSPAMKVFLAEGYDSTPLRSLIRELE